MQRTYGRSILWAMHLRRLFATVVVLIVVAWTQAADEAKLEPNAVLRFEFSDLPDTLMSMTNGPRQPAVLTAQLPENYTRQGEFGLVVFLPGGKGGRGTEVASARAIAGPRDYVCVSLPLFKRALDPKEPYNGLMIAMDDCETIRRAYRVMLQKLFDTVPNLKPEKSAIGGFSNGGHTTGVLLAGQDEFILSHFRLFYLIDGGVGPMAANVLHKPSLKPCRFLVLVGELPATSGYREAYLLLTRGLALAAKEARLDWTSILMRGHGHEFPPKYRDLVGQWIRGEKLTEIPPLAATRPDPPATRSGSGK